MNDISEQRPDFFEGEYLSASDLEQLVIYLRDQSARHSLGGHAWGIAAGLQLLEQTSPTGTLDVYLLPGYAVDGYGRAVVVINPLRLTVDLFSGQPTGPVQLWLRYDQGSTSAVRPGFEVCNAGDSYSRVAESYALEVGNLSVAQSQSGISVAGETVDDARTALRVFNDAGPIACDGSVPYQDLPLADESNRWLIPVGWVGWQAGSPGQLVALTADQRLRSRRARRYLGVVAESLYAADGLIRLRKRTSDLPSGQPVNNQLIDDLCNLDSLSAPGHDNDIALCNDEPTFQELVWVEGRLRVTDDVRILGGRLELRDVSGTNYVVQSGLPSVPLFFQRTDHLSNNDSNADLALLIGHAKSGTNRFLIQDAGPAKAPAEPCGPVEFAAPVTRFSVLDSGNVGIGTDAPDERLEIQSSGHAFIHLSDTGAPSDLYLGVGDFGGILATRETQDLRIRTGGLDPTDDSTTRVIVTDKGIVGVGTTTPDPTSLLTLEGAGGEAYLVARTHKDKHEIKLGANGDGALVAANVDGDDLVLASNGNSPQVWIKSDGNVGIGTSDPAHKLGVESSSSAHVAIRATQGNHKLVVGVDSTGSVVDATGSDDLQLQTNDVNRLVIKNGGRVGIGTDGPSRELDVRGNIALGSIGQYLAVGSAANLAIVAATVNDTVITFGEGCIVVHPLPGVYVIEFILPFTSPPVVTVTTNGDIAALTFQVPVVSDVTASGFKVTLWGGGSIFGDAQFSFIAVGGK